jgi:iron complex transport system permease protein
MAPTIEEPVSQVAPRTRNLPLRVRALQDLRGTAAGRLNTSFVFVVLAVSLAGVLVLAIGKGAYPIAPTQVFAGLIRMMGLETLTNLAIDDGQFAVLSSIRLPRVLFGLLIGAALAVAGAALQGLFRNPLADPGLIGVSAGAAVGAACVIVLGATTFKGATLMLGALTLPVFGFVGGLIATLLIYLLAQYEGRTSLMTMLLAGIAVNALAAATIGAFSVIATDDQLRNLTFWTFGSLGGATWKSLAAIALPMVLAMALLWRRAPGLNALMFGEAEAAHLGFDVQRLKRTVIIAAALLAGFAVSVSGVIGFVALVAPHVLRLLVGPDLRLTIPGSALLGGLLLVGADMMARTVIVPAELPIGILTAFLGAPFFVALLLKQREQLGGGMQ